MSQSQVITSNGYFLAPGFDYYEDSTLYVRNIKSGETVWVLNAGSYSINYTILDETETLVACATSETVVSSDKGTKDVKIFNLETGKLHTTIPGEGPFSMVEFFTSSYVVTCKVFDNQALKFWYIGDVNEPIAEPEVIFEITLHDGTVVFFEALEDTGLIITAGLDNTIKLWDYKK